MYGFMTSYKHIQNKEEVEVNEGIVTKPQQNKAKSE